MEEAAAVRHVAASAASEPRLPWQDKKLDEKRNLARDEEELVELGKFIPLEDQLRLQSNISEFFRKPGLAASACLQKSHCWAEQMPSSRLRPKRCVSNRIFCFTI